MPTDRYERALWIACQWLAEHAYETAEELYDAALEAVDLAPTPVTRPEGPA